MLAVEDSSSVSSQISGSQTAGCWAPRALQIHWCGGVTLVARRSCAELHTTSLPADSHSTTRITPNFSLSFCLSPSAFYLTTTHYITVYPQWSTPLYIHVIMTCFPCWVTLDIRSLTSELKSTILRPGGR